MGKSSHSEVLGVQCRKALVAKISERANAIGISKSRFAALILEKWDREGAKPVSPADSAIVAIGGFYPSNQKPQKKTK
ncbi:hypothetical protein AW736_21970 [Termitidicoccus mucosus]|uniref:Ribbon-helix-helix protein CopG domain-containing protein n=1 Tax=Termitidicoccus mucosus TaxID=1184151 RepID=A0A178IET9_9BACT|nr:hypothetical protein AW736_21970 [Opitutaceae bacterium TSB47]